MKRVPSLERTAGSAPRRSHRQSVLAADPSFLGRSRRKRPGRSSVPLGRPRRTRCSSMRRSAGWYSRMRSMSGPLRTSRRRPRSPHWSGSNCLFGRTHRRPSSRFPGHRLGRAGRDPGRCCSSRPHQQSRDGRCHSNGSGRWSHSQGTGKHICPNPPHSRPANRRRYCRPLWHGCSCRLCRRFHSCSGQC
jgi:hypothetical protein